MRKTLFLTAVVILAIGLLFAWADEKKSTVEDNNVRSLSTSNYEFGKLTAEERANIARKRIEQSKQTETPQVNENAIDKIEQDDVKAEISTFGGNPNVILRRQAAEQAKAAEKKTVEEEYATLEEQTPLTEFDKAKQRYIEITEDGFVDENEVAELKHLDNILNPPSENPVTTGLLTDYNGSETFDASLGEFHTVSGGVGSWEAYGDDGNPSGCARRDDVSGSDDDWLISNGTLTVPNVTDVSLYFDQKCLYPSYYTFHGVYISTDYDSLQGPDSANWDLLYEAFGDTSWETIVLDISSYIGQDVTIAFFYDGDYATDWRVDNVNIGTPPANPTGRCCNYTDPFNPTCADAVEEVDCMGADDEWVENGTCLDDPCHVIGAGDNCLLPADISIPADIPYSDIDQTTQNRGDNKTTTGCGYVQDEDMVYRITVTETTVVNITLDPQSTPYTSIAVMTACDGSGTCIEYSNRSGASVHSIEQLTLETGTYYLWVDSYVYSGGDYIPSFTLTIDEYIPPTGRCCYFDEDPPDLFSPLCADAVTEDDCNTLIGAYSGEWVEGLDCTNDPCPIPPANDFCADAMAVTEGTYVVDNFNATDDGVGTFNVHKNVWFCYTASDDGYAVIDLCPVNWDTKMAVYEGCNCDPLGDSVAWNDDDNEVICTEDYNQSAVEIAIANGQTYLIEVGNFGSGATIGGDLTLTITETACTPPANDNCVDAVVIDSYPASGSGTCFCASGGCAYPQDVWYALDNMPYEWNNIEIKVCPTSADIYDGGVSFTKDCDCNLLVNATSYIFPDTFCTEGFDGATIYLDNYYAGMDDVLYWPAWGIDADGNGIDFNYTITITEGTVPAQGDHCANPFVISSLPYIDSGNTCGFTDYCDLPSYDSLDVIYELTVSAAAVYSFSLCDSDFDTKMTIYKDVCCSGPEGHLFYNDDNFTVCSTNRSYIEEVILPGTYYVVVDGYHSCGNYILEVNETPIPTGACCYGDPISPSCVTGVYEMDCFDTLGVYDGYSWVEDGICPDACPPALDGDFCENAKVIPSLPYLDSGTTCDYTDGCSFMSASKDVIYELNLTESMELVISLCNSSFDTYLSVYEDDCCSGDTLYFNDDDCGTRSRLRNMFDPGLYYIIVEGYQSNCGNYELYVGAPPTGRCCYGEDPFNPTCIDGIEEDSCDVYEGAWVYGETCPCPVCDITCPPGAIAEGETECGYNYVDNYNGGCNSDPHVYQAITPGDIICGTSGTYQADDQDSLGNPIVVNLRDTDWFEATFTEQKIVTWSGVAEFPIQLAIINSEGGCDTVDVMYGETGDLCDTLNIGPYIFEAGTYWFFVAPTVTGDTYFNCPKDYLAWLDVENLPPTPANDHCTGAETIAPGASAYGYNYNSDVDADAPICNSYNPATCGPGVWYKVTGTGNKMTASTCNEYSSITTDDFDTRINVYAGDCSELLCITGDDDDCDDPDFYGLLSIAEWCSESGVDYYILVYGFNDEDLGYFQLDIIEGAACMASMGRCCYGDYYNYSCVDSVTRLDCFNTYGSNVWLDGGNCTDDPCPLNPGITYTNTLAGEVDTAGPGYTDSDLLTVGNIGTDTLVFEAVALIDPPPIAASLSRNIDTENMQISREQSKQSQNREEGVPLIPRLTLDFNGSETFDSELSSFANYSNDSTDENWEWLGTAGNPEGCAVHFDGAEEGPSEDDYLVSIGAYTVPDQPNMFLFWDQLDNYPSYYVLHRVGVSTNFSGDPATASWDWLYEGVAAEVWETRSVPLEDYRGENIHIAFNYQGVYADVWGIDNVIVQESEPELGRCCDYSDRFNVVCTDCYQYECTGQLSFWEEGLNCTDNPCIPARGCPDDVPYSQIPNMPYEGWSFLTSDNYSDRIGYDNFGGAYGTIDGIKFWGIAVDGNDLDCATNVNFQVIFYEDDAGIPGTVVATYDITPSVINTELMFDNGTINVPMYEYEATFSSPLILSDGWISIQNVDNDDCLFYWAAEKDENTADNECLQGSSVLAYDLAFCLLGTYQEPWLSIDIHDGMIAPGAPAIDITANMNAELLECGVYTGRVVVSSNDPMYSNVIVPVTFTVCQHGYLYLPGDANMAASFTSPTWPPRVIGGDVTYLVNYFRGMVPACMLGGFYASADINGNCTVTGSDVTRLVNYFRGMNEIDPCPDFEPAWLDAGDLPAEAPVGWPECENLLPVTGIKSNSQSGNSK